MNDARKTFERLLAGYLEGELTPAERSELKALLESDAALRSEFLSELQLHEALGIVAREAPDAAPGERTEFVENVLGAWTSPKPGTRRVTPPANPWIGRAIAAAALVAAALLVYALRPAPVQGPIVKKTAPAAAEPPQAPEPPKSPEPPTLLHPKPAPTPEHPEPKPDPPKEPAPKPPPEPKPDPVPAPRPEPIPAPRPETRSVAATMIHVRGDAFVLADGIRKAAKAGTTLVSGQGIETVGPTSIAIFEFGDRTQVELGGNTLVKELQETAAKPGAGKRIVVEQGIVSADVGKQPADQPVIFSTPSAEARIVGTAIRLIVDRDRATLLEVDEGKVKFTRLRDNLAVDVNAGYSALAMAGVELSPRLQADDKRKPVPKGEALRIDAAVRKGLAWLKAEHARSPLAAADNYSCHDELVLWTMIHAGVQESDPEFIRLMKAMLDLDLKHTYRVALQAMILEAVDRVKYQNRIAQCAQYLLDNQGKSGQWSYGEPDPFVAGMPGLTDVATGNRPKPKVSDAALPVIQRPKPRVIRKIAVSKKRDGGSGADNSNTQYAALGLRACHDAGILLPRDAVELAAQWWQRTMWNDEKQMKSPDERGWGYGYDLLTWSGSMTAGATASLAIYDHILGRNPAQDKQVAAGLAWLGNNFSVTENPGMKEHPATSSYWLYALERAAVLTGTTTLARRDWYADGARVLLDKQGADGSWKLGQPITVYDTCFAVLFLRRATMPLAEVASVDRVIKR